VVNATADGSGSIQASLSMSPRGVPPPFSLSVCGGACARVRVCGGACACAL
jgi:hypothetical protein